MLINCKHCGQIFNPLVGHNCLEYFPAEKPEPEKSMDRPQCPRCGKHSLERNSKGYAECVNINCDLFIVSPFLPYPVKPMTIKEKAKTDKVGTGLVLVPFNSILRIAGIFVEGLRYGKNNWKKGVNDKEFQEERLEHAMLHLGKWSTGDRTEDHLAKVAWFCVTQMELERLEQETKSEDGNS